MDHEGIMAGVLRVSSQSNNTEDCNPTRYHTGDCKAKPVYYIEDQSYRFLGFLPCNPRRATCKFVRSDGQYGVFDRGAPLEVRSCHSRTAYGETRTDALTTPRAASARNGEWKFPWPQEYLDFHRSMRGRMLYFVGVIGLMIIHDGIPRCFRSVVWRYTGTNWLGVQAQQLLC